MKVLTMVLCAVIFFVIFSFHNPYLLILNRTSTIVGLSFIMGYVLMTNVYGGLDIGIRKSRSIVFSMALVALFTDLIAHMFMCIMDYTVIQGGRFVYEKPHYLLAVLILQICVITGMAYLGNGLYFTFRRPQNCVMIVRRGDLYEDWKKKVERYRKQYNITDVCHSDDPKLLEKIDAADAVFIYNLAESERAPFVEYCYQGHKDLYYSVEMADVVMLGGKQVYFDDSAMVFAAADKISVEDEILKRAMDIIISGLGLLITSPLLLITAIAIKLDDGGDIFYRQNRATYGGRVFQIVKFRSMRQEVGGIHRSVTSDDDRITRVGHVIRKFRIDELPQLWNVLKGDMSIVGPRPEMLENVEKYTEELPQFSYRLRVKAGLTGFAQVYGRYNSTPKDKLILDLLYIENYSIWLDIKLIFRTFLVLLTPEKSTEAFSAEETRENQEDGEAARS
jgi:exopolysaccharide biosynthesis polyprenyl glycosylphosphotransferase